MGLLRKRHSLLQVARCFARFPHAHAGLNKTSHVLGPRRGLLTKHATHAAACQQSMRSSSRSCTQEIAPGATVQSLVTHQQQRTLSQHEQTRHTSHTAQHVSRHLPGLKLGKRSWQGARKAACAQAGRMAVTYRILLDLCPLLAVPGWGLPVAEARDTDDASALSPALLSGCSGLSPYTAQASSHVGLLSTFQPLSPKYCKAAQSTRQLRVSKTARVPIRACACWRCSGCSSSADDYHAFLNRTMMHP